MYPRTNYEMTEADLKTLLEACQPTPAMWGSGGAQMFSTPQENANRAWANIGKKMGFDSTTVEPRQGMGVRFFTAVPNETPEAKAEREAREKEDALRLKIATLETEIKERQEQLAEILKPA